MAANKFIPPITIDYHYGQILTPFLARALKERKMPIFSQASARYAYQKDLIYLSFNQKKYRIVASSN